MSAAADPPVLVIEDARRLNETAGARFALRLHGVPCEAFVVRFHGGFHAFVNRCRHQSLPLDFGDAHFFDESCDALVCCHHGARYDPQSGRCVDGPCEGARLTRLALESRGHQLWCLGAAP
jgi:nitrite reductase/ring-hydroxylating ferredoxin subunit